MKDILTPKYDLMRYRWPAAVAGSVVLSLIASGCTVASDRPAPATSTPSRPASSETSAPPSGGEERWETTGDCEPFVGYAQNRWAPYGASVKDEPSVGSATVGGIDGNEKIGLDGWVGVQQKAYPDNPFPFQGDIWFRLVEDGSGNQKWVNSAAVRGAPVSHDPSGQSSYGGDPQGAPADCEIK